MKKKIAVPLEKGVLCGHFGHCESFAMIDVENDKIVAEKEIVPPAHEPGLYPKWIKEQGATDVICGGIGEKAKQLFAGQGVELHIGVPVKPAKELVMDFIAQTLQTGTNSCNHK
ncbi:MAG: ATPase [Bacteroides sp.]|jgi:predicted Fe-Mo cluster-binding NifX family protein|nr:ATPase [Bacteroides sp.]